MCVRISSVPYGVDRFKRIKIEIVNDSGETETNEFTQSQARMFRDRLQNFLHIFSGKDYIVDVISRINKELENPQ